MGLCCLTNKKPIAQWAVEFILFLKTGSSGISGKG
jgi:hypothetical protein